MCDVLVTSVLLWHLDEPKQAIWREYVDKLVKSALFDAPGGCYNCGVKRLKCENGKMETDVDSYISSKF